MRVFLIEKMAKGHQSLCKGHVEGNETEHETASREILEETKLITDTLATVEINDYDRLIQLCDALAGSEGVLDIEQRMNDVKNRYGYYPQPKWDSNMRLKAYFEVQAGSDIYEITQQNTFQL